MSKRRGTYNAIRGNQALRFEVFPGDRWEHEGSSNSVERSELRSRYQVPFKQDIWFSFDLIVLSGLETDARWTVVGQLHQTSNPGDRGGSPPFAQYIYPGGRFAVQIRSSNEQPLIHNPSPRTLFEDQSFRQGYRYRFVYRLCYDPREGALDAWRNGQRIISYRGPLGYPGKAGPYLKFGIYRAAGDKPMRVEYHNIRVGRHANDVAPRVGSQRNSR